MNKMNDIQFSCRRFNHIEKKRPPDSVQAGRFIIKLNQKKYELSSCYCLALGVARCTWPAALASWIFTFTTFKFPALFTSTFTHFLHGLAAFLALGH